MKLNLSAVTDFTRLEALWRDLEDRADISFFQSWAWTGCLAEERFPNPVLLEARERDRVLALALFNRTRSFHGKPNLWLGESGNPLQDAIFIEKNGIVLDRESPKELLVTCLTKARTVTIPAPRPSRPFIIHMSGVDERHLHAAQAFDRVAQVRTVCAPAIELDMLRGSNNSLLPILSRNTRYQLRRSERMYAAAGPLRIIRARTVEEAQLFLTELAKLHQRYWTGRGRKGVFANPFFERFHRTLIYRAFQTGATDLLKITAGEETIGYLYNFTYRGHVSAYQSGFDYDVSKPHLKPGLTSHHLAIEMYLQEGARCYDFLAGADRYKLSLATSMVPMHWIEIGRQPLPPALAKLLKIIQTRFYAAISPNGSEYTCLPAFRNRWPEDAQTAYLNRIRQFAKVDELPFYREIAC